MGIGQIPSYFEAKMKLQGQIIWVTGASSGVGEALAKALSQEGCKLLISARNEAKLEEVRADCKHPERVQILPLDLDQTEELPAKTKAALALFGDLDAVVHCAGLSQRSRAEDTILAVDERLMRVNYLAPVSISKNLLPHFLARKKGQIVIISSVTGKYGTPLRSGYAASKHALHGFFDSLRAEHPHSGLSIMLVCLGFIRTQLSMNALTGDGSPQLKMDSTTANGIAPKRCAELIIKGMKARKRELYIAGFKELAGVYAKRFIPGILAKVLPKIKVA